MKNIETVEIRGLTVKTAWLIFIGILTIEGSILAPYFGIANGVKEIVKDQANIVIQVDTNKKKIEKQDDEIRTLQMRITVLETKISRYENR